MSTEIKDVFYKAYPITITLPLAKAIIKLVDAYETRGTHPLAYNTYSLGIHKCVFLTSDKDDFFNLFNTDDKEAHGLVSHLLDGKNTFRGAAPQSILSLLKNTTRDITRGLTSSDVKKTMGSISSVNDNYKVATDPFNIFVAYILHLLTISKLQSSVKEEARLKLLMYLQYRFFTSLVNHRFPYTPDEATMTAMFESLTDRFDIKQYGTWKKVMQVRAQAVLSANSIHAKTLQTFTEDRNLVYFLSDLQTRIRAQVNLITAEYMKVKDERDTFGTYTATGTNLEGEKVLVDNVSFFDRLCASVYQDTLSTAKFLDDTGIKLITKMFSNLNTSAFRTLLVNFSDKAVRDYKAKKSQQTVTKDGSVYLQGAEIFITSVIQKSYRFCSQHGVDVRKPIVVLKTMKDAYTSSRISDQDILQIRESASELILQLQSSRRDSVLSAMRTGLLLYILILSFKYLK